MPLYFIRLKLKTLDPTINLRRVLRHRAAELRGRIILNERGFQTYVLRDGLNRNGS